MLHSSDAQKVTRNLCYEKCLGLWFSYWEKSAVKYFITWLGSWITISLAMLRFTFTLLRFTCSCMCVDRIINIATDDNSSDRKT